MHRERAAIFDNRVVTSALRRADEPARHSWRTKLKGTLVCRSFFSLLTAVLVVECSKTAAICVDSLPPHEGSRRELRGQGRPATQIKDVSRARTAKAHHTVRNCFKQTFAIVLPRSCPASSLGSNRMPERWINIGDDLMRFKGAASDWPPLISLA
jgi:hypothetical protein